MIEHPVNENSHYNGTGPNSMRSPSGRFEFGTGGDLIDVGVLWAAIRRRRLFVLAFAATVTLGVAVWTLVFGMSFRAVGQLYLGEVDHKNRISQDAPGELDLSGETAGQVASEIEILRSHSLIEQAVLESGLNATVAWAGQRAPSYWQWRVSGRDLELIDGALDQVRATDTRLADTVRYPQAYRVRFVSESEYELWLRTTGPFGLWPKEQRLGRGTLGQPLRATDVAVTLVRGKKGQPKAGSEYDLVVRPLDRVVEGILHVLRITAQKETAGGESINVVALEFTDASPQLASSFLQNLMGAYLSERQSWKTEDASAAEVFVGKQLQSVRESLDQLQSKLAEYRRSNGVVVLDDEAKAMIEQVGKYEEQRVAARLDVAALTDVKRALKAPEPPLGAFLLGEANDKVLENLAASLAQAKAKLTDLESQFQDAAPEVREQRAQVAAQLEGIRSYVSSRQLRAQESLEALNAIIGQFEEKLKTVPAAELGLAQLSRESEVYSRTYSYLLERQQQAAIAKASALSKNRILDSAEMPLWEDSPNLLLRALGVIVGLILGAATVSVRTLFAGTFQSQADVRRVLGSMPVVAAIPRGPKERRRKGRPGAQPYSDLISLHPTSRFTEAFRVARARLYSWEVEGQGTVLVVTSPTAGDGKTTCVRSLASVVSAGDKSVLVVDADLRRPSPRKAQDSGASPGLRDVLAGTCAWRNAIREVPGSISTFSLIPSGGTDRPELLTNSHMVRFVHEARRAFDYVLIDCPSFPQASEALALSQMADGTLTVLRLNRTPRNLAAEHIVHVSTFARRHALIINDADIESGLGAIVFRDEPLHTPATTGIPRGLHHADEGEPNGLTNSLVVPGRATSTATSYTGPRPTHRAQGDD